MFALLKMFLNHVWIPSTDFSYLKYTLIGFEIYELKSEYTLLLYVYKCVEWYVWRCEMCGVGAG